ncbi:hypothetical protein [Ureibacillus thermosphaericus]
MKYEVQIIEHGGYKDTFQYDQPNNVLNDLARHLRDNDELKKIVVKVREG